MCKISSKIVALLVPTFVYVSFVSDVYAADKAAFSSAYQSYQKHVDAGNFSASLPHAQRTYQLSKQLYSSTSSNRLAAIENYALNLRLVERHGEAEDIFLELLSGYEEKYGKHSAELIPILGDLQTLASLSDKVQAETYRLRKTKLYLRHHSSEYVSQLKEKNLPTTQHAKNMQAKLVRKFKRDFKLFESTHWSIVYHAEQTQQVEKVAKVMENAYRSVLSFLVAFNVRSTPIDKKMTAVYFASKDDYVAFVSTFAKDKNAQLSSGIYSQKHQTIFFFDRGLRDDGKIKMVRPSTVAHEVAHQMMFAAGLQRNVENQPAWLVEGLAASFEFHNITKEYGPHTQNYARGRIYQIKKIIEAGDAPTLESIVALTAQAREDRSPEQLAAFYPFGSMLVRYLYEFYPDEFRQYFSILAKSKRSASASDRKKMFRKAFGDPALHNAPFEAFVNHLLDEAIPLLEASRQQKTKITKPKSL